MFLKNMPKHFFSLIIAKFSRIILGIQSQSLKRPQEATLCFLCNKTCCLNLLEVEVIFRCGLEYKCMKSLSGRFQTKKMFYCIRSLFISENEDLVDTEVEIHWSDIITSFFYHSFYIIFRLPKLHFLNY